MDALSQEILPKSQREHLWRDIKLLSEARKAPDHTYIMTETIGNAKIIHAILPVGMSLPVHSWEGIVLNGLILLVYTGVVIKGWDRIKSKEDFGKAFGCRKCNIWFHSGPEYTQHWKDKHEKKEIKKES